VTNAAPHLLSLNSYHHRRGGSDVVYFDHAALFEENGWQNTFFSMHHPSNLASDDAAHFAKMVDYELVGGPLDKMRTALSSIYNFDARKRVRELVRETRFDVAHAHCVYHHLTPAVFQVLADAGVPVVMTALDLKVACPAYRMMNANGVCEACKGGNLTHVLRNRCIKQSFAASAVVMAEAYLHRMLGSYSKHLSKIVSPSRFYRDKIVEWGFPADKVAYIPNFSRIIGGSHRRGYDGPMLFFGRLSEEKGVATLVEASAMSGIPVDVAGTGPIEPRLRQLAAELSAPVRFLGRLEGDRLWERVGNARAVIVPSEWYENAPMSVLESYQLERPVIGARIGGIPELVELDGGSCGWLFEPGDAAALAETMSQVAQLSEAELRERGRRGREHALGAFSKENYYRSMTELYAACR
jgi:glycosyltransferase involved in cell wall biosynthesis